MPAIFRADFNDISYEVHCLGLDLENYMFDNFVKESKYHMYQSTMKKLLTFSSLEKDNR